MEKIIIVNYTGRRGGGGGYAIDLDDGSQVYVDAWKCNVEGQFYDGCSAVVYYNDYPSSDNIYAADIYGNQGLIVPDDVVDDDQGGWAGSGYYESTIGDEDFGYWDDNGEWVLYGDNG